MERESFKNQFLIATANLDSGIFKSSVTYICEHNEEGAMGVIVNRPSTLCIKDILADVVNNEVAIDQKNEENNHPVMVGGPIGLERGFVLHHSSNESVCWDSSLEVTSEIALTGSKDILVALSEGRGPQKHLVLLGYAGWEAGQLESELVDNDWLTVPAVEEVLFSTPYHKRASEAAKLLGVDLASLSTIAGNA